jgi:hypothetical protein
MCDAMPRVCLHDHVISVPLVTSVWLNRLGMAEVRAVASSGAFHVLCVIVGTRQLFVYRCSLQCHIYNRTDPALF